MINCKLYKHIPTAMVSTSKNKCHKCTNLTKGHRSTFYFKYLPPGKSADKYLKAFRSVFTVQSPLRMSV